MNCTCRAVPKNPIFIRMGIPPERLILFIMIGMNIFFVSGPTALFISQLLLRKRNKHHHLLDLERVQHQYEQELLRAQIEIQEETFRTIFLEIHDNIGQQLSLSKLYLSTIEESMQEKTAEKVGAARDLISQSIADLRDLCRSLTRDTISSMGLVNALQLQLDMIEKTGRLQIDLQADPGMPEPAAKKAHILYRMLQETLSNVLQHARATIVHVHLHASAAHWTAVVTDDGRGFDTGAEHAGNGLRNLHHRARLIDADLRIQSSSTTGTTVRIIVRKKNLSP